MKYITSILFLCCALIIIPVSVFAATPTAPNLKVAFIGDSGEGTDFQSVLNLIKAEGAEIVFHQGDFSYTSSATTWSNRVNTTIPNIIYLGSDGNHDDWTQYAPFFQQQINKRQSELTVSGTVASGNYAVVYKGLKVANIQENGYTTFAKDQLQNADNIWKVCGWHKNQQAMQVGGKTDERGWPLYEDCRAAGALIMTGHEHSYERTKTLTNMTMQTVDSTCSAPNQLCVAPGKTFVVVSGLGGTGIRNQDRCLTGCNGEWAKIYTSDQEAQFGALFMIFNYQGNPNVAHGYFKNISGQIVDEFNVTAGNTGAATTAPTTSTPTIPIPTNNNGNVTLPPGSNCAKKNIGDADCKLGTTGQAIDIFDYAIWYSEFIKGCNNTNSVMCGTDADGNTDPMDANFNYPGTSYIVTDNKVDVFDYAIWIQGYISQNIGTTPTITPTLSTTTTITPTTVATTPTSIPTTPTPVLTSTPMPPGNQAKGIWISKEEIMKLPTSGNAWNNLLSDANNNWGSANLGDNNSKHDVYTLAGALVYARTGDEAMKNKTIGGLQSAMKSGTTRTLELARGLQTYIIAADIIGYQDSAFKNWVKKIIEDTSISGRIGGGLYQNALKDSTNWGGHERASAIAASLYLQDNQKLQELARAYREYIGENVSPKTIQYDPTNWHATPNNKAGVNRKGSTISGKSVSGVLPEDWRRGSEFKWLPTTSGYMWEGMQGFIVSAVLLHRANLVPFSAGDGAVIRAMNMLYGTGEASSNSPKFINPPAGDDTWIPWVVNHYGNTTFPVTATSPGKNMGYTDWTHQ